MKKMLFSALACVAFAGSAFASNEVVEEKDSPEIILETMEVVTNNFFMNRVVIETLIKYAPCFSAVGAVDSKFKEWNNNDEDFRDDIKAKVWQDCTNTIDG